MNDLVSIIMPSYNTGKYITETIKSVQAQTYSIWELIIVDDCSSDETDLAVREFLADDRIIYVKNDKNLGAAESRNRALNIAKGRWIAFLDSDDLWYPEKLEKQIRFMKKKGCHFSYTAYSEMNEDSKDNGVLITGPKKIGRKMMYAYCWPGCLTVMYDKNYVGGIQVADIKKNNDYALWLKVCQKADCYFLNEVLARYRKRSGSISNQSYRTLISWHYRLFHDAEQKNAVLSVFLTVQNLFFGCLKKMIYVKRDRLH